MPQYTFDGDIYEEEEVLAAAEQAGLSLNDYASQFGVRLSDNKIEEPENDWAESWQNIKNNLSNTFEQIGDVGEFYGIGTGDKSVAEVAEEGNLGEYSSLGIAATMIYESVFGREKMKEMAVKNPDFWKNYIASDTEAFSNVIKNFEIEKSSTKKTMTFSEADSIVDYLSVGVGAVINVGGSLVFNAATGFGAGYFMNFMADNFIEANKVKAEGKGITFDELLKNNDADVATPVKIAFLQASLERWGLSNVTSALGGRTVMRNVGKSIAKKVAVNKTIRVGLDVASTGSAEAFTEMSQYGLEFYNKELAIANSKGEKINMASTVLEGMLSPEGVESGLQGFFGGGGLKGARYSAKAMGQVRKNVSDVDVEADLNNLVNLKRKKSETTDEDVLSGIEDKINIVTTSINEKINKGNKIYESLSNNDISEIENIGELADVTAYRANELNKKLLNKVISEKDYNIALEGLTNKYKENRQKIKTTIDNAVLAERFETDMKFVRDNAGAYGLKVEDNLTEEQINDKYGAEAASSNGFIDPKTNTIVINKERARDARMVDVASHELLHGILKKSLIQPADLDAKVENVLTSGNIKQALQKQFGPQFQVVIDAVNAVDDNGKLFYTKEYMEKNPDEWVTLTSDAIRDGKIKFNENVFTKIGDLITPLFRRFGFRKIGFENGKQVYNFLKEYNKSINKGKLSAEILKNKATSPLLNNNQKSSEILTSKGENKAIQSQLVDDKSFENKIQKQFEQGQLIELQESYKPRIMRILRANYSWIENDSKEKFNAIVEEALGPDRGVLQMILGPGKSKYDPSTGVPLSGYIGSIMKRRGMIEYVKKEYPQGVIQKNMSQGNTQEAVDKKTSDSTAEDAINLKERKKKEVAEEKPSLRKELKIETGSDMYNKVKNAVIKTFGTKLPSVESGKIKKALQKAFRTELKTPVAKFLGTRSVFEANLKKYGKEIYEKLDQSLINKRFAQFKVPVLDKDGKQKRENTPQGNAIFKKKPYNQGEWISYFLSKGVGASTRGTRKDALAESISEEFGFDATMEVLQDPIVNQRRKEILELVGQEQLENEIQVIAKEIDRNPDMKFSKGKNDYMTGIDFMNQAGSLIQEINNGTEVFGTKGEIKVKYESVSGLVDYDNDVVKLIYDAYHNGRVGFGKQQGLNVLKKLSKKLGDSNVGTTYEYMIWQKIEDFTKNNSRIKNSSQTFAGPGEGKVYLAPIGSFKGGFVAAPDLILTIDNATASETQIGVELKASAARLGKNSPDFIDWANKTFIREKRTLSDKKMEGKVMEAIKNVISKSEPLLKALEKLGYGDEITSTTKIKRIDWDTTTGRSSVRALTNDSNVMVDGDFVANHYNSKGVYYIHILGKGTFYLGSDPLGIAKELGITKLEGDFPLKARINAVSDKKGNITMKITVEPELQLSYVTSKSDFDITSTKGLNALLNTKKFKANKKIAELIKPDIKQIENINTGIKNSRGTNKKPKGITVLDFDDTLATSKSLIKYTTPEGGKGTLTPEQYASTYQDLQDLGYDFDFSEFNKVVDGKIAPLFQKALKLQKKFGNNDMFVLTARPAESAPAIFAFLKSKGLNIPLENITGLANSTSEAKALWIANKVGEGYNDFYFADDALQNVQAVKNMLDQFDVKSKVQQAKVKFSKGMNNEFNNILEDVTGIESFKRFERTKARKRGADKGKFRLFIPPSHEDFVGLLYNFMGKGKKGDAHRNFFEQALVRPLNRAYKEVDTAKQAVANDYKALNKQMPEVNKMLSKKTPDGDFTYQDAIRVYLWDKHGYKIPGLSPVDQQNLVDLVKGDGSLQSYAETLNVISKQETYVDPGPSWESGNIRIDLVDATGRVGRASYFAEFQENADTIFSEENLNKIEAAYGTPFREALEDMLHRTKTGINRPKGSSSKPNMFMNWLNASVAGVMFLNVRSSLLQQMSNVNYLNFADNNILAAGKAFANQPQYWKDFAMIFNSDMLKQRRGGLQTDINGAELAEAIKKARPGNLFDQVAIVTGKALRLGFLPTQIGDNIAIATGGAAFYRNRVNKYIKDGLSKKEAEAKAFTDFQDITQSTQQSARPDMTSKQQASWIGKLVLNFLNTPSQYNRIIKKAGSDILNRRITPPNTSLTQSNMSNASRILYYGAAQNLIFYSLQTALFAVMFGSDDEDEDKRVEQYLKKKQRVISGSIDTILRGSGIYGVALSTLKNMAIKFMEQREKGYNKDESAVVMEMLNFSPVVGIKARRIVNAEKTLNYNKKVMEQMETFDIDNPMWSAVTNYTQTITTAPVNKLYQKTINLRNAADNDYTAIQRLLFLSGYTTWSLNLGDTKKIEEIKRKIKAASAAKQKSKKKNKKFLF